MRARRRQFQQAIVEGLRSYRDTDLRWSYLVVLGLFAVGMTINLLIVNGWVVWPVVFSIGSVCMIHEAADRNGQGVPPLHVYALFFSATVIWIVGAMFVSLIGPLVMVAAALPFCYYAGRSYLKFVARKRLVAGRRMRKQCIHCGYPVNSDFPFCEQCGEDPGQDPNKKPVIRDRTAEEIARVREVLDPPTTAEIARKNEQALLDAKPRKSTAKK